MLGKKNPKKQKTLHQDELKGNFTVLCFNHPKANLRLRENSYHWQRIRQRSLSYFN